MDYEWNRNSSREKQTLYVKAQISSISLKGSEIINFTAFTLCKQQYNTNIVPFIALNVQPIQNEKDSRGIFAHLMCNLCLFACTQMHALSYNT